MWKKINYVTFASFFLVACSHTPPLPPPPPPPPLQPCATLEPVRLTLTASQRLNIGENGDSLATTVRLYLLKDSTSLVEASLDQLIDGDRALIGEDLISVQEITLYPGEKAEPLLPRKEGANLIAVVALFRRPNGPTWRAIRKLETPNPNHCHVSISGSTLTYPTLRFHLEESRIEMQ